jgi:glucokinase
LREHLTTIHIDNDCVAALRGELCFGAAQNESNAIYVTWSTGIGFGLCVDGHILRGKSGNAGHAGHMLMSEISEALCGCGNVGDLESLVGGRNLGLRLGQSLDKIFSSARSGDETALAIVHEAAQWFGRGLYNLIVTLDTQCVLVGGSVWRENEALLSPLVQNEISTRFPALTNGVRIQSALLGELVTDIGALAAVMPEAWIADWRLRQPWQLLKSEFIA